MVRHVDFGAKLMRIKKPNAIGEKGW